MSWDEPLHLIAGVSFLLVVPIAWMWHVLIRVVARRRMREHRGATFIPPAPKPRAGAPPLHLESAAAPRQPRHGEGRALYARMRRARGMAAGMYLMAGLVAACVLAWAELQSGESFELDDRLGLIATHAWPAFLTVVAVAVPSFRTRMIAYAAAAALLLGAAWAVDDVASFLEAAAAPTLLLLFVMNRWLKTLAPLLIIPTFTAVVLAALALGALTEDESLTFVFGAPAAVVLAALLLFLIVRGYTRKWFSDLSYQLGFLWVVFSLWYAVEDLVEVWWAAPVAIAAYGITTSLALPVLRREAWRHAAVSLLVLRVFGPPSRTHRLFEEIGTRWRYIGPIHLIAGADSVISNLDIRELVHIATGRSRRLYVANREDMERRLSALDTAPDPDGRYRVNDFFCFADTWKPTFTRLLAQADAVLVDLGGYGPQNAGVAFELAQLLARRPLDSFVLMVDGTTDIDHLGATLTRLWRELDEAVPNARLARPVVRVLDRPEPRRLVAALCDAVAAHRLQSQA